MNSQIDTADGRNQNGTKMVARSAHMPSITLKNIPEDLYLRLKASAERNRRSINSEAIVCLQGALSRPPRNVDDLLADIDRIRNSHGVQITNEEIDRAKNEGRE